MKEVVHFRVLTSSDHEAVLTYLYGFSEVTKSRFGPHGYDLKSIQDFYSYPEHIGIAGFSGEGQVIAYAILRLGYLEHDRPRLESYGLTLDPDTDATYAPSVADEWQGKGIGKALFTFVETQAKTHGIQRMILWGGVQSANERAVTYYERLGFLTLGRFEYHGWNQDMMYMLSD